MEVLPIATPLLKNSDNLAEILRKTNLIKKGDIVVVSSKAVAVTEGAQIDLKEIDVTREAKTLAKKCNQQPEFTQAILNEVKRLNGKVLSDSPFAVLTELKPTGMKGRILCPNAGLDLSNIGEGFAIGWPIDPIKSAKNLSEKLNDESPTPVIISDSCCVPARLGVVAFALVASHLEPFSSKIGSADLFGKKMRVTQEAIADQLATAANAVMGNTDESIPAAIIRGFKIPDSDFLGWVPGMVPENDLFSGFFKN